MSRWIRLDVGFDDADWVFTLSEGSQLAWVKLLCYVKRDGIGGRAKIMSPMVAAKRWGVGEESVEKMIRAAEKDGAIVTSGGEWEVTGWTKYQDQHDPSNAERQRRYREKQSQTVTGSNALHNVTQPLHNVTTPLPVSVSVSVSEDSVESRAESPREETLAWFEKFYSAYPVNDKQKRQSAEDAFIVRVECDGIAPEAMVGGAKRYRTYITAVTTVEFAKLIEAFLDIKERFWEKAWKVPANTRGKPVRPSFEERLAEGSKRIGGTQ